MNVCWLDICGKVKTRILSPKTTYASYLVFKFVEGAHGCNVGPAEVSVRFIRSGDGGGNGDEVGGSRNVYRMALGDAAGEGGSRLGRVKYSNLTAHISFFPLERGDGWIEIEMGEFFNDTGEDGEVEMHLWDVKGGHWKSGLIVEGIEIRPKDGKAPFGKVEQPAFIALNTSARPRRHVWNRKFKILWNAFIVY